MNPESSNANEIPAEGPKPFTLRTAATSSAPMSRLRAPWPTLSAPRWSDEGRQWRNVEVDLTEAKMVDSVGLNLIVAAFKAVQQGGGKMLLRYSNSNVHRTFEFTRLGRHLDLVKV